MDARGRPIGPGYPPPPLLQRTVLDTQMAYSRWADPRPWGARPWVVPIATTIGLIVVGQFLSRVIPSSGNGRSAAVIVIDGVAELILVAAVWTAGREIAARSGGWARAFGWAGPDRHDWLPWIIGFGAVFVGRIFVGVVATALFGSHAVTQAQNVQLRHPSALSVGTLLVLAVLIAPAVEELMFRGLLLRTFMRRLRFWPAALLSTLMFGLIHTYEVHTLVGAAILAIGVGMLGLLNCYLVRITGRLAPAIMVHASFNLLTTIVLIARVNS